MPLQASLGVQYYTHGLSLPMRRCGHNLLLAHAAAAQLYRRRYRSSQRGALSFSTLVTWPQPVSNSSDDARAAQNKLDAGANSSGTPRTHMCCAVCSAVAVQEPVYFIHISLRHRKELRKLSVACKVFQMLRSPPPPGLAFPQFPTHFTPSPPLPSPAPPPSPTH